MKKNKGNKEPKPPMQAAKAQSAPRMGQKTRSPLQRYQDSQRTQYGLVAPSYNVGRTRRQA